MASIFLHSTKSTHEFLKMSLIKGLLSFLMILSITACDTNEAKTENEQIESITHAETWLDILPSGQK